MSTCTVINRQGRCVFWFERKRTPKPCARTLQGSRKARKTDVSEDDEDDEDDEESGTARKSKYEVKEAKLTVNPDQKQFTEAEVSELTRCAAAIRIGYAYMDLVQPPLDTRYQFGRWNNREPADGKVGNLSINSLGYAGFMLTRSVEEQEALKAVEGGVEEVLRVAGVPPVEDVTVQAGLPTTNV